MLDPVHSGKYELRPAVKKLYQLCPELSTPRMTSCVLRLVRNSLSVASHGVCFMLSSCVPIREPDAYELHCKVRWMCKMSNSLKVLTQFYRKLHYFTHNYVHTYRTVE
jgi:hypothetical protein